MVCLLVIVLGRSVSIFNVVAFGGGGVVLLWRIDICVQLLSDFVVHYHKIIIILRLLINVVLMGGGEAGRAKVLPPSPPSPPFPSSLPRLISLLIILYLIYFTTYSKW